MACKRFGCTVVKNTFIEIADESETQVGFRRQVSEPISPMHRSDSKQSRSSNRDFLFSESEDGFGVTVQTPQQEMETKEISACRLPAQVAGVGAQSPDQVKSPSASRRNLNRLKDNDVAKIPPPWSDVTTVMMRNLPNRYSQQRLLDELRDAGFFPCRHFDFFYLPMDHSNAANLGYCFINFTETQCANAFAAAFMGKQMLHYKSSKTVVVMAASIQGYEKNYAYYSSTRIVLAEDSQYRPLFFRDAGQSQSPKASMQGKMRTSPLNKTSPKYSDKQNKRKKYSKEVAAKASPSNGESMWMTDAKADGSHTPSTRTSSMSTTDTTSDGTVKNAALYVPYVEQVAMACLSCGRDSFSAQRYCRSCAGAQYPKQTHHVPQCWGSTDGTRMPCAPVFNIVGDGSMQKSMQSFMQSPLRGNEQVHLLGMQVAHMHDWNGVASAEASSYTGSPSAMVEMDMMHGHGTHHDASGPWVMQEAPSVF